eukprot:767689-Prymnesium_polylepis.1
MGGGPADAGDQWVAAQPTSMRSPRLQRVRVCTAGATASTAAAPPTTGSSLHGGGYGIDCSSAADHGVSSARISALDAALPFLDEARCARATEISRIRAFTSGMYSTRPSGMSTMPKRLPSAARSVTVSASCARMVAIQSVSKRGGDPAGGL